MTPCLTLAVLLQAAPAVEVAARPQPVLVVEGRGARTLNFDLLIRNATTVALDVDEIQLSVYDRGGALVLRRFLDGNGTRPSIRTIDAPSVPAGYVDEEASSYGSYGFQLVGLSGEETELIRVASRAHSLCAGHGSAAVGAALQAL